jgi:hypothetical protein
MQSECNIESACLQKLQVLDYIDVRRSKEDWKLAKIVDRQGKCLIILYDGYGFQTEVNTNIFSPYL